MKAAIQEKLTQIEQTEQVKILLAVESGSRAWGFASPDSDYDVRFIYVRPRNDYLRLEKTADVIELPIDALLDINGWDLTKALQLLHKSNPTLAEWLSSPIVYRETAFAEQLRTVMERYYSPKSGLHHYISMAMSNYRDRLKGATVKAKQYFYVLRPILACRWILEKGTPPPMLFSELMESELAPALRPEVERLLCLKMNAPEIKRIPKIDALNAYLDSSLKEINQLLEELPAAPERDWEELNALFLSAIG